jgi:16S rRNA (cytosine967-C5)-methyltransferase
MNSVRQRAWQVLCGVMLAGQYASLALRKDPGFTGERDQALLTQLVYGTLRNQRYCRWLWSRFVARMPQDKAAVLLDMSTYELLFLDQVPDYAAVNEAVDIARRFSQGRYAGLVNAVLRKTAAVGKVEPALDDDFQKQALLTSHPAWLARLWKAHYGEEAARKIMAADGLPGIVGLRANPLKTSPEELLKDPKFSVLQDDCLVYDGNILKTDYFARDLVVIQSPASQQAARAVDIRPGETVLDLCSAPGTKAVQLAMAAHDQAPITAVDVHPQRVELILNSARRYGLTSIHPLAADGTRITEVLPPGSFDKVLLDAPCSGLGTLRHKPEIKLRLKPEDLDELVEVQRRLSEAALAMVKPGGLLVYSTCTLDKKENEQRTAAMLEAAPDFTLESQKTLFPFQEEGDGFYIARLRRSMIK